MQHFIKALLLCLLIASPIRAATDANTARSSCPEEFARYDFCSEVEENCLTANFISEQEGELSDCFSYSNFTYNGTARAMQDDSGQYVLRASQGLRASNRAAMTGSAFLKQPIKFKMDTDAADIKIAEKTGIAPKGFDYFDQRGNMDMLDPSNPDHVDEKTGKIKIHNYIPYQKYDFSTFFKFRIHGEEGLASGAGMTFVLHADDSRGARAMGRCSGCLGLGGIRPPYKRISPSMAIEFDILYNSKNKDYDYSMIGLNLHGSMRSVWQQYTESYLNNGKVWNCWIDYDGRVIEVRLTQDPERPEDPSLQYPIALDQIIALYADKEEPKIWAGFTAEAGRSPAHHDILSWHFRSYYRPFGSEVL